MKIGNTKLNPDELIELAFIVEGCDTYNDVEKLQRDNPEAYRRAEVDAGRGDSLFDWVSIMAAFDPDVKPLFFGE